LSKSRNEIAKRVLKNCETGRLWDVTPSLFGEAERAVVLVTRFTYEEYNKVLRELSDRQGKFAKVVQGAKCPGEKLGLGHSNRVLAMGSLDDPEWGVDLPGTVSARDVLECLFKAEEDKDQALDSSPMRACAMCRKPEEGVTFSCCARCRIVLYCSRKCQRKHWKPHKKICKRAVQEHVEKNILPKDLMAVVLEFKGGMDLWTMLEAQWARDDVCSDITTPDDVNNWDMSGEGSTNAELFRDNIFYALLGNLITLGEKCNVYLDGEHSADEQVGSTWMSNVRDVDERVLEACVTASFDRLSLQIKEHPCWGWGLPVPTMQAWLEYADEYDAQFWRFEEEPEDSLFRAVYEKVLKLYKLPQKKSK
jgi:hypothetical protein